MKKTFTKSDLIHMVLNEAPSLSRLEANGLVESFFDVIIKSLEDGQEVKVSGFGNFILRDKKPRIGRNPRTKEEFPIKARRVVSFHTSNLLKDHIKSTKED